MKISMAIPLVLLMCLFSVKIILGADKENNYFCPQEKKFSLDRSQKIICFSKSAKTNLIIKRKSNLPEWGLLHLNFSSYKQAWLHTANQFIVDNKFDRYILSLFDVHIFFYPLYLSTPGKKFHATILRKNKRKKLTCFAYF